jgi:hypothetical protein
MVSDNDSGYTTNNPVIRDIKPGIIIAYRLKASDRPTNPYKLWRGKVKWCNSYGILVEILEEDPPQNLNNLIHSSCPRHRYR